MSYLIGLYVYYHGNNLPVFGIVKGEREEDVKNEGMKHPEEINSSLVDPALIEEVRRQEEFNNMPTYEDLLRKAMEESQKNTYKLYQAGEITNSVFNNTPENVIQEYEEESEIDLSIFDSLNGF